MLYAGFLLSIFLDYVRPGTYLPIINVIKLNSIVPLSVLLATIFVHKGPIDNEKVFAHTNTRWILFFFFLMAVSVLHADVTSSSYKIFNVVLGYIFWFYIIVRVITDIDKVKGLFAVFVFSHVVILLLNPQVVLNPETRSYIHGNAFLGDGNDFSLSVCITLPMCLYLLMDAKKVLLKALYIFALVALLFGIIGTQSRGATVALACIFLYLWWAGRQKMLGVFFIIAALAVVITYAPPVYFERLNTIKNYESEGSAQGRIIAWKTAIRMAEKYPVTGVGTGHFAIKLGTEFRPPEFGNENLPWLTAHSVYFLVIGELGIPGIITLFMILGGNFFRNHYLYKEARGSPDAEIQKYARVFMMLNASLIAFAVGGAFLSVAYYPHMYVLAGIFTAVQLMFASQLKNETAVVESKKAVWYEDDPVKGKWDGK